MVQYRSTGSDVLAAIHAALLAAVVGVLVATLSPFQLQLPSWSRFVSLAFALRWTDVVLNLALFAPLGFLLSLRGRVLGGARQPLARALLVGAGLSAAIEAVQLFVPTRCPSAIDVVTNAAGFAAGASLCMPFAGRAQRALLALLHARLNLVGGLLGAALCATLAVVPQQAHALHDGALATLTSMPVMRGVRVIAILSSLGAASFTFALAVLCARASAPAEGRVRREPIPRPDRVWV